MGEAKERQRREQVRKLAQEITEKLADEGKIIAGGWAAFELMVLQSASSVQRSEMRKAFFAGAQHLFASIMATVAEGEEVSEQDMNRMELISKELDEFFHEMHDAMVRDELNLKKPLS